MTTPTNWPDPERPGVPSFPERDGWHWLSNRPDDTPFPAEWSHEEYLDGHTEWFWEMGEEREDAHEMRTLYYHGPCPLPGAANETGCVALDNITTLTEQARKNISVASGARKMAKTVFPFLAEIDRQVIAARNSIPALTPTQIAEMLAGERERCAKECDEKVAFANHELKASGSHEETRYWIGEHCAATFCADAIRGLGDKARLDPRIEAAARELCIQDGHNPDGDDSYIQSGMGANWRAFKDNARTALAVADEAAWRHVSITPRSTEWVNIVSKQGGEVNYAVAQWDYSKCCWRNPELEMMYSPAYFTHWMPLPAPPNAEASPAPETITIP